MKLGEHSFDAVKIIGRQTGTSFKLNPGEALILEDEDGEAHYVVIECPCGSPVERGSWLRPMTTSCHFDLQREGGWSIGSLDPLTIEGSMRHYHHWYPDGETLYKGQCHFFVKEGLIEWCSDSFEPTPA